MTDRPKKKEANKHYCYAARQLCDLGQQNHNQCKEQYDAWIVERLEKLAPNQSINDQIYDRVDQLIKEIKEGPEKEIQGGELPSRCGGELMNKYFMISVCFFVICCGVCILTLPANLRKSVAPTIFRMEKEYNAKDKDILKRIRETNFMIIRLENKVNNHILKKKRWIFF